MDTQAKVLFYLTMRVGADDAMNRWELCEKVFQKHIPEHLRNDDNKDDREIRQAVSDLRREGHLICNVGKGEGYYIAENADEFWRFYAYYVSPIKERAAIAAAMKKAAEKKFPDLLQPSLFMEAI